MFDKALKGGKVYWSWVTLLVVIAAIGFIAYLRQWCQGLGITGMGRDVSWGLYIANFTFLVGVAASAVMVVLPHYLHNFRDFGRITIFGEFLAVAAVTMSMLFVFVDLGQPARAFNVLLYPSPQSLLFWDMIVLGGYLVLNLLVGWKTLEAERKSEPVHDWVKPLILLSIPWAVSIHTVTAFIYSGLGARPFWFTALLAPRFLASAFASGPSLLILLCLIMRRFAGFDAGTEAIRKVSRIVTYALAIHIFFFLVELFTVFYSGIPEHAAHFRFLLFGLEGKAPLVPWMWLSLCLSWAAFLLLLTPWAQESAGRLGLIAAMVVVSVWIEKGLGLIVTGFVPTPLGGLATYVPTLSEAMITLGVWAFGLLILSGLYRIALSVKQAD
jgi:Ni/Fe-hydrogenase subunit HybB-like protein